VDKLAQKLKSFGGKIRLLERQDGEAPEVPPSATVRDRTTRFRAPVVPKNSIR
jgi:hypothetical protein